MKTWIRNFAGGLLGLAGAAAASPNADAWAEGWAALDEPLAVATTRGGDFVGFVARVDPDGLVLRAPIEKGEAELVFAADEIARVRFPGNALKPLALERYETGDTGAALEAIDALFAQRSPFFALGWTGEANFFAETLPLYRKAGRTFEVLARAEVLHRYVDDPALRRVIEGERLIASHALDLTDEAARHAAAWIEHEGREPDDARGACVQALLQIAAGEGDAAFFTVLHPIVFAGGREVTYLEICYALVVELARRLEQPGVAERLAAERTRRGIPAPAGWSPFVPPDFSSLETLPSSP
ncbi:MAG: hypothetical protein ACLFR7_03660 [Opitutales bacterium]